LIVTLGLFGGQFHATGQARYLYAGLVTIFLDGLRYMDALQIAKVRRDMSLSILQSRERVSAAVDCLERVQRLTGGAAGSAAAESVDATLTEARRSLTAAAAASRRLSPDRDEEPDGLAELPIRPGPEPTVERAVNSEMASGFNRRVPWYPKFRDAMLRRRVRTHLVSGVEFQMFVFIVGPLIHQVLPVMIAAGVGLLGFEIVILVKLGMSTGDFARLNADTRALGVRLDQLIETVDPDGSVRREVAAATTP
jgi:hypothetical protein